MVNVTRLLYMYLHVFWTRIDSEVMFDETYNILEVVHCTSVER